jgi:hypothetical protein
MHIPWENIIGSKLLVKIMIGSTYWEKNMTDSTSGKKNDWQHILGKNMIGSTFWEKHDSQHILRKKHD